MIHGLLASVLKNVSELERKILRTVEQLRALSPPLKYSMYVVGVLLVFFLALGVGAIAAIVVSQQSIGQQPIGNHVRPDELGAPEFSKSESTGTTRPLKGVSVEPSGDLGSSIGNDYEASFVHRATEENSRGDYTYVSESSINGDPDAVFLVSRTADRESGLAASYNHHIGVWYEPAARKWAIFNQDRTPVPAGTTFEVSVPRSSVSFIHSADLLNTAGHYTYVDNSLTNGRPDAALSVTQNWNPGGGGGVYNNHPIDTRYDKKLKKWAIYNVDGASMPQGASFNIVVSTDAGDEAR